MLNRILSNCCIDDGLFVCVSNFFMFTHLQGLEGLLYLLDLNLAVNQITEIGEQSSRPKK